MKITEMIKAEVYHIEYKYDLCENLLETVHYTEKYRVLQCKIKNETDEFLHIETYFSEETDSYRKPVNAIINKKNIISVIAFF